MLTLAFDRPHQNILSQETRVLRIRLEPGTKGPRRPASVAVMLDASSSMRGDKFEHAKEACRQLARALRPEDRLSLGVFHGDTASVVEGVPGVAAATTVDHALATLKIGYGTRIDLALDRMPALAGNGRGVARLGVLVTDGYPHDADRRPIRNFSGLWHQAETLASSGLTLAAVGLGPARDFHSGLLFDLCERGGGTFLQAEAPDVLAARLLDLLGSAQSVVDTDATIRIRTMEGARLDGACRIRPLYRALSLAKNGDAWAAPLGELEAGTNDYLARLLVPAPGDAARQGARDVVTVTVDACGRRTEATAAIDFTRDFRRTQEVNREVDQARLLWLIEEKIHDLRHSGDPMRSLRLSTEIEGLARDADRPDIGEAASHLRRDLMANGSATDEQLTHIFQAARKRDTARNEETRHDNRYATTRE